MKYRIDIVYKKNGAYDTGEIRQLNPDINAQLHKMFVLVDKNGNIYTDENGKAPVYVSNASLGKSGPRIPNDVQAFFITYARKNGIELKRNGDYPYDFRILRGDIDNEKRWDNVNQLQMYFVKKECNKLLEKMEEEFTDLSERLNQLDIGCKNTRRNLHFDMLMNIVKNEDIFTSFEITKNSEKSTSRSFVVKTERDYDLENENDDLEIEI